MLSYLVSILVSVAVVIATLSLTIGTGYLFNSAQENGSSISDDDALKIAADKTAKVDERVNAILKITRDDSLPLEQVVPIVARATAEKDELIRVAGDVGIRRLGKSAVPILKNMLGKGYFESKDFAAVCGASRALGTDAIALFPQLQEALNSEEGATHKFALYALQDMGDENIKCMDRLIELLGSSDFNTQIGVCRILEKLGPKAEPAADKLVDVLENGQLSGRSWAAIALGAIGKTENHDIAALLTKRLDAFTQIEKLRAMIGLGHMGPNAKPALEKVTQLMNDPSKSCQPRAAVTRWKITGEIEPTIQVLNELLGTVDYKRDVLELAAEMGPAATPLASAIANELSSDEIDVQELAVIALSKIGKGAQSTLPKIRTLLQSKDALLQQAARDAIAKIEASADSN